MKTNIYGLFFLMLASLGTDCFAAQKLKKEALIAKTYALSAKSIGSGLLALSYGMLGVYSLCKGLSDIKPCFVSAHSQRRGMKVVLGRQYNSLDVVAQKLVTYPAVELSSAGLFFYLAAKTAGYFADNLDQLLDEEEEAIDEQQ
jgi:hypothetical protein